MPFQKYPFVEEYWDDFVAKKTTDDFRSESEAHRALQGVTRGLRFPWIYITVLLF